MSICTKVLADLDVEKLFHKVAQRPGKPFWFGHRDDVVIFALPGNPVSAFMCACRYVVPYVKQQLCDSLDLPENCAILTTDVIFKPDLTYFLPVKVSYTEGCILATPVEGHGSGDLANLNDADANGIIDDGVFVSHDIRGAGAVGGEFDHLVVWVSPFVLYNAMIQAGQLH